MSVPRPCWFSDLGLMDFQQAHSLQLQVLEARATGKLDRDAVLVLEHPSVFTLGRRGNLDNLKVPPTFLSETGIGLIHIERGGDITFHGPGQLVLYPIIHLKNACSGIAGFVEKLEEAMIRTAADFGVCAARDPRNHGVWVGGKKMGFIGIAVRRGVSYHGIALNVKLSLEPFGWIHPCGLTDIEVTSLDRESDSCVSVSDAKKALKCHLEDIFRIELHAVSSQRLKDGTLLKTS